MMLEKIAALPRELQAKAKSAALAAHSHPQQFSFEEVFVRLAEKPDVDERGMLRVVIAEASVDGRPVKLDNPYLFHNPPLVVGDQENIPKAFQVIVADAMRMAAQR